jgi:DNA-binding LacI/PurR family transcriptional regulator
VGVLDEIAEAAGVSRMTVSNVLNGKNKETWPSTAQRAARIREIAEKLNYRPNAAAKAVVTGRFGSIGLLSSTKPSTGVFFEGTFQAVRRELSQRDMHVTMGDLSDYQLTDANHIPKILRELAADGLLISYIADIPERMVSLIHQYRIPSVWINTILEADCVYPDDFDAGKRAAEHLLQLGHRRIAYVQAGDSNHYSVAQRRDGYLQAMQEARCQPHVIERPSTSVADNGLEPLRAWLSKPQRPTAIIAYEAMYALPVFCAALSSGLRIPQDISLLTFHDKPVTEPGICISTMLIPAEKIGQTAVDMVLLKIDKPDENLSPQAVAFGFEKGRTCAPPPLLAGAN